MVARVAPFVAALVLAGCSSATASPNAAGSPQGSLPATASPLATASPPATVPASVAPLDLGAAGWWRLGWRDDPAVASDHDLLVGLLDGTQSARIPLDQAWIQQNGAEIVRGPTKGLVLYGRNVIGGIDLHLVSTATGEDRIVERIPGLAEDAEIAPSGDAIYWIDRSRASGGVWRLDLASGGRTRILAPVEVAVAPGGIVLAAVLVPRAQLVLSADGGSLAAMWCGRERCLLQVVHLGDDAIQAVSFEWQFQELLGFAAGDVALSSECIDPLAQTVRHIPCDEPDARARAAEVTWQGFGFGVELPAGWAVDLVAVPDAPPMSFTLRAVAVPDDGGDPVPLDALGTFSGQG